MDSFKTPSLKVVKETLRKIPTLQLRRVFYRGNKNPKWVKPLFEAGAFVAPSEPVIDAKGYIREPYWPEIDYLKEMASFVPEDVVEVLLSLKESKNSWIQRAVFEIGATIPANHAARLVPMITKWGLDGLGWRSDPEAQATMIRNLLSNNEHKSGVQLANLLLKPVADKKHRMITAGIEEYWYAKELPTIASALGTSSLRQLTDWLVEYEKINEHLTDAFDITYMARSVIEKADRESSSIEQSLIDSLLKQSIESIYTYPARAIGFLAKNNVLLIRRITLAAINAAITKAIENHEDTGAIITAAIDLLKDSTSTNSMCRVEYAKLIQTIHEIDPSALDFLPSVIEAGPYGSAEIYKEKLERDHEEGKTIEERARERTEQWQHSLLAAIGNKSLPKELQRTLKEMDTSLGKIHEPLSPMIGPVTSWVGPVSDINRDELLAMKPEEIIAYLQTWKPTNEWQGPTHEGQGRELTNLISTNPEIIAGVENLVDVLRPTYLRAILQGWEAAIKSGIAPDWDQLVATTRDVLDQKGEPKFEQQGRDFDDDPDYSDAKRAAIGLLEEIAKRPKDITIPDTTMESIANLILNIDPEEAWADYISSAAESKMDPLTISLNWQWPIYFRALIILLTHGKTNWYEQALQTIDRELARDDSIGASSAVIGERFGNLSYYAPDWLARKKDELIGNAQHVSKKQEVALTTLLATSSYYNHAFDLIKDPLTVAIKKMDELTPGWSGQDKPSELIGYWVIYAYIWNHLPYEEETVKAFFTYSNPENTGKALGHIAWTLVQPKEVDPSLIQRLGELWDLRVAYVREHPENKAELNGFYWFIRSGKYEPAWWLPRLIEAAELHGDLNTQGMVSEALIQAAELYPKDSLKALTLLLDDKPDGEMLKYDLRERAAPVIIARGISSNDVNLARDARQYMNKLGSQGFIDLEERVNRIIDGQTKTKKKRRSS